MKDYDLQIGRNIAYSDIASRQKVCVIGSYVAQELFGSAEKAINETLKINGYAFKVVGIVETRMRITWKTAERMISCGSLTA